MKVALGPEEFQGCQAEVHFQGHKRANLVIVGRLAFKGNKASLGLQDWEELLVFKDRRVTRYVENMAFLKMPRAFVERRKDKDGVRELWKLQ